MAVSNHIAQARREGVNIFGAGGFARDLAKILPEHGIKVHGFLTSSPPSQDEVMGLPVRQASSANLLNAPLWMGAFNHMVHSDYGDLAHTLTKVQPQVEVIWPQVFYGDLANELGFRFWLHPLDAYQNARTEIGNVRGLLADNVSREIFDDVLAFRTDAASFSKPPKMEAQVQYFPSWLRAQLQSKGVNALHLVDGGAYRGETVRELSRYISIDDAWTFEPDAQSYSHLVHELADWEGRLTNFPAGLSSQSGFATFSSGQGESSRFGVNGTHHVPVVALDECLHQAPINFIKLDLEGHELPALTGMRKLLVRNRPTLAVAVYHLWDDLWKIPAWLHELDLNYQFRLSVHGSNTFDVVLYAASLD